MDQTDTTRLAVFVRGVDDHFNIFEELLAFSPPKEQTRCIDILQVLTEAMGKYGLMVRMSCRCETAGRFIQSHGTMLSHLNIILKPNRPLDPRKAMAIRLLAYLY